MTYQDLPARQKSQRLMNRNKNRSGFQQYKQWAMEVSNINELLPGLNDISDAFEALPLDLAKYFTLLKEIDAKCINTVPQINFLIKKYVDSLHEPESNKDSPESDVIATDENSTEKDNHEAEEKNGSDEKKEIGEDDEKVDEKAKEAEDIEKVGEKNGTVKDDEESSKSVPISSLPKQARDIRRLTILKHKINEIIPCLEEKMHVASVATDLVNKHMLRINNDYKYIINNNEIPESVRIGPLNHPAMIVDLSQSSSGSVSATATAHSQRSESRREALAARKANRDEEEEPQGKKRKSKEATPDTRTTETAASPPNGAKKRTRKENSEETPPLEKKKRTRKEDEKGTFKSETRVSVGEGPRDSGNEPTYCYCDQVSFGEMVGCDGDDCKREWFHLPCIGYKNPPKGMWYCDDCLLKMRKRR